MEEEVIVALFTDSIQEFAWSLRESHEKIELV
jgi:hypothetical protein